MAASHDDSNKCVSAERLSLEFELLAVIVRQSWGSWECLHMRLLLLCSHALALKTSSFYSQDDSTFGTSRAT